MHDLGQRHSSEISSSRQRFHVRSTPTTHKHHHTLDFTTTRKYSTFKIKASKSVTIPFYLPSSLLPYFYRSGPLPYYMWCLGLAPLHPTHPGFTSLVTQVAPQKHPISVMLTLTPWGPVSHAFVRANMSIPKHSCPSHFLSSCWRNSHKHFSIGSTKKLYNFSWLFKTAQAFYVTLADALLCFHTSLLPSDGDPQYHSSHPCQPREGASFSLCVCAGVGRPGAESASATDTGLFPRESVILKLQCAYGFP